MQGCRVALVPRRVASDEGGRSKRPRVGSSREIAQEAVAITSARLAFLPSLSWIRRARRLALPTTGNRFIACSRTWPPMISQLAPCRSRRATSLTASRARHPKATNAVRIGADTRRAPTAKRMLNCPRFYPARHSVTISFIAMSWDCGWIVAIRDVSNPTPTARGLTGIVASVRS